MKNKYYELKQIDQKEYQIRIVKHLIKRATHICGETCALYNSLGCPYACGNGTNTGKYCDEWRCNNGKE